MFEHAIRAAINLLDSHLPASANRLLDKTNGWGSEFNALRARVLHRLKSTQMKPGIYCMTTAIIGDDDTNERIGLVIPLKANPGDRHPPNLNDEALAACDNALQSAASSVESGAVHLPSLHVEAPESLRVEGRSVGLAAALSFVGRYCKMQPSLPVIATGVISSNGKISTVDGIEQKVAAAREELGTTPGLILVPTEDMSKLSDHTKVICVASLEEALVEVWGNPRLNAHREFLSVDGMLARAESQPDHQQALAILGSLLNSDGLSSADKAMVLLQKGARLRHQGKTDKSALVYAEMYQLFPEVEKIHGPARVETMQVEQLATAMDQYKFEDQEKELREMLSTELHLVHNRVRCQGMLAQVCSLRGKHDEAIALRKSNLDLQHGSDSMRRERPRTLSMLIYEAARGGVDLINSDYTRSLFDESPPGDPVQTRYNNNAIVRSMLLLGQHERLMGWLQNEQPIFGHNPGWFLGELFTGKGTITGYPEVTTARSLMRVLRRCNQNEVAITLCKRVLDQPEDKKLLYWIAKLNDIELSLVLMELERVNEAKQLFEKTKSILEKVHPEAYMFHLDCFGMNELGEIGVDAVERCVDGVYY